MSWRRTGNTTSGWAAFDLKQRRKRCLESDANAESYPSLLSSIPPPDHGKNFPKKKNGLDDPVLLDKPFVSVLLRTVDLPPLMVNNKDTTAETRLQLDGSSSQQGVNYVSQSNEESSVLQAVEKLQEHYPWADKSLIEDVLAGVYNNIDEASSMLKAMESSMENTAETEESKFCSQEVCCEENTLMGNDGVTSQKIADFSDMKSFMEEFDKHNNKELLDDHVSCRNMLLNNGADTNITLCDMRIYPIEPEWEEEDDVYLVHRKDAIRMMRSASHDSKVAGDAYIRGDHLSAQYYSRKAREAWISAERLNTEAAKEILSIRNSKNDLWTLDLHGLHAAEAIQALREHLRKIESLVSLNHLLPANRSSNPLSVSLNTSSYYEGMKVNELPSSSRKSTNLQVITGKGNHSRGQAALPAAIRSFLIENGYHYYEARPGVITVRPKFRRG